VKKYVETEKKMNLKDILLQHFDFLYPGKSNKSRVDYLLSKIEDCRKTSVNKKPGWGEKDVILITYGDSILKNDEKPLRTLYSFLSTYLKDEIKVVHILPFFPYSSDDGFSVIDYRQVDPNLGGWDDVSAIGKEYNLMFDLVINHVSQYSQWFQNYLQDISPGRDFFIEVEPNTDLSAVVRPRSLPLLTKYQTVAGEKYILTTFSADQIDLNFKNPEVLLEMLGILLFYIGNGAKIMPLRFYGKKLAPTACTCSKPTKLLNLCGRLPKRLILRLKFLPKPTCPIPKT
jgi:hypothetical protein